MPRISKKSKTINKIIGIGKEISIATNSKIII